MSFRDDLQLSSLMSELNGFKINGSTSKDREKVPHNLLGADKLHTPSKRLSSLSVSLDPQFSSKIPTRSPSTKSLKLIDPPQTNNSKLPVAKRFYSDSKHTQRKPSLKYASGIPTSRSMYQINTNIPQAPSYLKPTLSSLNRLKAHEKENVSLQRRQSMKLPEKRGMVSSSSVMDLKISKFTDKKPSIPPSRSHRNITAPIRRSQEAHLASQNDLYLLLESSKKTSQQFRQYLSFLSQGQRNDLSISPMELAVVRPDLYEQLTVYERGEIQRKQEIYFTGNRKVKVKVDSKNYGLNFGFDDKDKNYVRMIGDHINYRYEILSNLGQGSFGSVVCARDHKTNSLVAIKIVKNEMDWSVQALSEVKCLKQLTGNSSNVIEYVEHFHFRSHFCIVTELLLINLYELIELNQFKGIKLPLLKQFGKDILVGMKFIHDQGLIHCDMKPENLMLAYKPQLGFHVKIIDFGSSCKRGNLSFSYLQSRFYRAPEVCLGARYNHKIDIWSFGAIMAEMYTGLPMFQAKDEIDLISYFIAFFGAPTRNHILHLRNQLLNEGPIINASRNSSQSINFGTLLWRAFNEDGSLNVGYLHSRKPGCKIKPSSRSLRQHLLKHCGEPGPDFEKFVDSLSGCLTWNHTRRMDCDRVLSMPFYQ